MAGMMKGFRVSFVVSVISAALLLAAAVSLSLFFLRSVDPGKARILLSEISQNWAEGRREARKGVAYAVVSPAGVVEYSSMHGLRPGGRVEVFTLTAVGGVRSGNGYLFSGPLTEEDVQTGILLLHADAGLVTSVNAAAVAALAISAGVFLVFLLFCTVRLRRERRDIAEPAAMLNAFSDRLLQGDFTQKLPYDGVDEMGRLCHSLEMLRDELKSGGERERMLKAQEKFLLACISHDLKTPLAIISGSAESIRDGMGNGTESAEVILKKCGHLSRLIDDILEQTKTELNEFSIRRTEAYAEGLFASELAEWRKVVQEKGIGFFCGEIPNPLLSVDRRRISQLLGNIMTNSVKYTEKGGKIDVNFRLGEGYLVVCVEDSGSGIRAADLPFVFDKFFRGEKARSQSAGSGLGLSIAKYIVEKHGGAIECDSVYGKGTKVEFSLPVL